MKEVKQDYESLSPSKWDCKYQVVFIPKRRWKALFGQVRRHLGKIFHALAQQKDCQTLEGYLLPDPVHRCIAIPPKHPVASVIGFLKGKSAAAVARQFGGRERKFNGEHLWARGYSVSTGWFRIGRIEQGVQFLRRPSRAITPGSLIVVKGAQSNHDRAKVLFRKDSRRRRFLDISSIELQRKGRRLAEMPSPVFNLDRQRKREIIQPALAGRGA
jgi:putative transposase